MSPELGNRIAPRLLHLHGRRQSRSCPSSERGSLPPLLHRRGGVCQTRDHWSCPRPRDQTPPPSHLWDRATTPLSSARIIPDVLLRCCHHRWDRSRQTLQCDWSRRPPSSLPGESNASASTLMSFHCLNSNSVFCTSVSVPYDAVLKTKPS
jgi:hypothetical protein